MTPDGPRILIAAALAKIIQPLLQQALSDATVRIAEDRAAVEHTVSGQLRFDVVVTDLTWNDYTLEYDFDGLDVLDILRRARRQTSVIFAAQVHGIERDHLDEAVEQPEVVGRRLPEGNRAPATGRGGRHRRPGWQPGRARVPARRQPA